ncbi:hypothetical protein [Vibrio atypicus]|jgi:hypothetical protein|uniref:hypothetical protein n=1 Tax=Vibrio atypicus TaxID=558271 RepID=UPI00135AE236|nr:hypothetical protein [Vibrio atypicus]
MIQRVIKLLWLALLAMVLPAQAVAYFAQIEGDISSRLERSGPQVASLSKADSQAIFDEVRNEQQSTSQPVSQTESDSDVIAIINLSRWGMAGRHIEDGDLNELGSDTVSSSQVPPYKLYCHPLLAQAYWADRSFTSNHRISGWKESNALYVALNSQFA